jgi:transglutaminase-like putative cysteine protease
MKYSIRHITRFDYSDMIRESVMEVRKAPRSDSQQHCYRFDLTVDPRADVHSYKNYLGNTIHHFDVPRPHNRLVITADAFVEVYPRAALPVSLDTSAWAELDAAVQEDDFWDMLMPSHFIQASEMMNTLAEELDVTQRRDDPLSLLREINTKVYQTFDYEPSTTNVDSPTDHALAARSGVCQDFAHIMITLLRHLKITSRYVSGYLYTGADDDDRSADAASHAWAEAWLPGLGWIGFDPTNNLIAGDRHISVAVGRDYADVPPTHGIFRGEAESELSVAVQVKIADELPFDEDLFLEFHQEAPSAYVQQQQQQQQ